MGKSTNRQFWLLDSFSYLNLLATFSNVHIIWIGPITTLTNPSVQLYIGWLFHRPKVKIHKCFQSVFPKPDFQKTKNWIPNFYSSPKDNSCSEVSEVNLSYTVPCSHTHLYQGYRKSIVNSQSDLYTGGFLVEEASCTRRPLYTGRLLGWRSSCTKVKGFSWWKRRCIHLEKGILQVVYMLYWFWVARSRIKENLKRVAWGLDVGHKDRTRINLVCLRLLISEICFPLHAS